MSADALTIKLPKWYDLHAHFRQDNLVKPVIADHIKMGCAGILAMPNTKPPVAKVFKDDPLPYWSIEEYAETLRSKGGDVFDDILVPLYLTKDTTADMIAKGVESDVLRSAKYYPPHGTTGADFGFPFEHFIENGVFAAMEKHGVILNIHGEEHGMEPEQYFDRKINAEEFFYTKRLPQAVKKFPKLRIVCEHITTKIAADFVTNAPETVAATVTPQHLIYTVGHLLQGFKYHLYCLPLIKFEEDRAALRAAVTDPNNTKFFAGTDSAPHTTKATACGCAAGCYTGGIAPQIYAQAFEMAGIDLNIDDGVDIFKAFLCLNGPNFYGLAIPDETFTLEKSPQDISPLKIGDQSIVPLPLGMQAEMKDAVSIPWKIV